jgi:hypothetical protein
VEGNTDNPKNSASYTIHGTQYSILCGVVGTTSHVAGFDYTGPDWTTRGEHVAFSAAVGIRRPLPNLRELVGQLLSNPTICLPYVDNLMYQQAEDAKATIMTTTNVLNDHHSALLPTYGTPLTAGLVAVFIRLKLLWDNGRSMGIRLLDTLMTTSNRTLDELTAAACVGSKPMPDRLIATHVQCGEFNAPCMPKEGADQVRSSDNRHDSFAIWGEIAFFQYCLPYI